MAYEIAANTCVRFTFEDLEVLKNKKHSDWLSMFPPSALDSKFGSTKYPNNKMAYFDRDNGIYDFNGGTEKDSYNFAKKKFTISFWLRFKDEFCNDSQDIEQSKFLIGMEDGTVFKYAFTPDTKAAHHFCVMRDLNNIYGYIDGVKVIDEPTTADFNMDSNSFIYLGTPYKWMTGFSFYADDIYIFRNVNMWDVGGFTPPDDYLYAGTDYYTLYIRRINEASSEIYAQPNE